jgi:adenylate kinase
LDELTDELNRPIDLVLYIEVEEEELLKRLTGRRICRECGATYHTVFAPPKVEGVCDRCGGELYQRPDDAIDTVKERLKVNLEQTQHLIRYYESTGKLHRVDGEQPIERVTETILSLIRGLKA